MAETSTIFGFMKYVSATDILSDFKKTVDSYFVNSLIATIVAIFYLPGKIQISKCSVSYQNKRISIATINKTIAKYRVLIFSANLSEFNSGCASSSSNRFFAILSSQLIVTSS